MTRPQVDAVLFDVGGVLTTDPWESILMTPGVGVADRLGLSRDSVREAAMVLWRQIAVRESNEFEFWAGLERLLNTKIPQGVAREAERLLLLPNPEAMAILAAARDTGARVGVVSDNTSFWYPKQVALLGLAEFVDEPMEFLSFREGVTKSDDVDGLFHRVLRSVRLPSVVVDDRETNLRLAQRLGFSAVKYRMGETSGTLIQAIDGQ